MARTKARTNFHAEVYGDGNYQELLLAVGCQYKTRGMLLVAWELAQKYWIEHKGVPSDKWPESLEVLLRFGFAKEETRENGRFIYVAGSAEHCAFLEKQAKNGAKGGRSKSPNKLKNLRQYQEKPEARPKPDRSQKNPTEVSNSNSYSNSEIIPFPSETGAAPLTPAVIEPGKLERPGKNGVALWLEAYHLKYKVRYELSKQDTKMLTDLRNARTEEHTAALFAAYCAIDEPLYANAKHPLSLFFRDIAKISVAAQTGIDPSKPQKFDPSILRD